MVFVLAVTTGSRDMTGKPLQKMKLKNGNALVFLQTSVIYGGQEAYVRLHLSLARTPQLSLNCSELNMSWVHKLCATVYGLEDANSYTIRLSLVHL